MPLPAPRTAVSGSNCSTRHLGTTDFAEQVNFRRAVEGELERSFMAISEVEKARVHVTFAKDSVFVESRQPAKASVMLKLRPGGELSSQNIQGITHLAASAVEGLQPENVSVLDMNGSLLNRPRRALDEDGAGSSDARLEYRQSVERDLLIKIRATLDPLLGSDRYRAGVTAEVDFTSGEQSEETFEPDKSVMLTSQKTEDVSGAAAAGGGVPGTASNLPRPVERTTSTRGSTARRTENVTYQTSASLNVSPSPRAISAVSRSPSCSTRTSGGKAPAPRPGASSTRRPRNASR